MIKSALTLGFLVILSASVASAHDSRQTTIESSTKINVQKELRTFVEKLIQDDPALQNQYEHYLTKDADGTAFGTGDFQTVAWEVVKSTDDLGAGHDQSTEQSEVVYLVLRPVLNSSPGEYQSQEQIAFKIRATESINRKRASEQTSLFQNEKLTLKFEKLSKIKSDWI